MEQVLKGKNIVLTRTKNQSVQTVKDLTQLGANVISFPTIKIATVVNNRELDHTIKKINEFNTIIFTSENAVKSLLEKVEELDTRFDPNAFFVISIGERTTEICLKYGFRVDFQPMNSSSESLIKELGQIELVGRKIFIPCSTLSKPNQFIALEESGAKVSSVATYANNVNDRDNLVDEIESLKKIDVDLYIFTSPSTFKGFVEIMRIDEPKTYFDGKNIAVIGPVTEKAVLDIGVTPKIVPNNFSMNYLIKEIIKFYSKEKIIN